MSSKSFENKLKDLNLTNDELKRFSDALKNDEFRKLFFEYANELSDPKNRELYEQEIRTAEEQRGSDVTFVHPQAGHVLKTTIDGSKKCFINIATNEHVDKPSYNKTSENNGSRRGVQWSLPHCLAGPHEDFDHESKPCTVYDVIFSPDTYRMAETNERFMKMLQDSALDSIENNFHCKVDRNNVKKLKMKFKGVPKATIIRKKKDDFDQHAATNVEEELKKETEEIIERVSGTTQNHKVVLSSHNRSVEPAPSTNANSSETITPPRTDENGFTIPTYRIVHRGDFDMQDCANSLVPQIRSMRPKELLVEIHLPLCASTSNVDLDVCERSLKLYCNAPKYSLDLHLPYPVRESDSHARFDKKQRKLLVTLAVIKEAPSIVEIDTADSIEENHEETVTEVIPPPTTTSTATAINEIVPVAEQPATVTYTSIPFEYKQGLAHLALVLYVKNVDQTSLTIENDGQHVTIRLSSSGSGCYPLNHQLCLDFCEPMVFDTAENSTTTTFNEDNVLLVFKKTSTDQHLTQFASGLNRDDMKINYFTAATPTEKSDLSSKQTMKKEQFMKFDPPSSGNGEHNKKLSKKQAKKLAKENRKKQDAKDDNEQLTNKISTMTLEQMNEKQTSTSTNDKRKHAHEEYEDALADMPVVVPHPSIYRRHMSESQVDLDVTSNGEVKLKSILKNTTKYRSYSESLSDSGNGIIGDFQREELICEASSAVDDLTSSNENNSIVTSPDSSSSNGFYSSSNGSANVKRVTFNNQVSRKTFKPGGPVSGMKKLTSTQQRKLKKRKRQDSLNSQSSDQDDTNNEKQKSEKSDTYKNPVELKDVISWEATGSQSTNSDNTNGTATKSAVRFTNPLIFELDN